MQGILIFLAIYLIGYILYLIVSKIIELDKYYKYLKKLEQFRPMIEKIDLELTENEFKKLIMQMELTKDRLYKKYKIGSPESVPLMSDFIKADALAQRKMRRSSRPRQ